MVSVCGHIIGICAEKAYGPVCYSMEICQYKKKSLEDCIFIFKKYWFPVFEELLLKQCQKALDDLSLFLSSNARKFTEFGLWGNINRKNCIYSNTTQVLL